MKVDFYSLLFEKAEIETVFLKSAESKIGFVNIFLVIFETSNEGQKVKSNKFIIYLNARHPVRSEHIHVFVENSCNCTQKSKKLAILSCFLTAQYLQKPFKESLETITVEFKLPVSKHQCSL